MNWLKVIIIVICQLSIVNCLTSCHHDDIPQPAQTFIHKYFPQSPVVLVETETEDNVPQYSVWLADGTKIEFDMQGEWRRVARKKTGVPQTLIPQSIMQYVRTHYPQDVVTKFSRKDYGYKLELSDDMDLRFNHQCQFIEEID